MPSSDAPTIRTAGASAPDKLPNSSAYEGAVGTSSKSTEEYPGLPLQETSVAAINHMTVHVRLALAARHMIADSVSKQLTFDIAEREPVASDPNCKRGRQRYRTGHRDRP